MYLTDEIVDDAVNFDLVQYVVQLFAEEFEKEMARVITRGSSVGQPTGYALGGLGIATIACAGNLSFTDIINLIYALPNQYLPNAKFFVHKENIRELRKLQDDQSRYIWEPAIAGKQPNTIYGYEVVIDNNLPTSELYFGDMKAAYLRGIRHEMRVAISQTANDRTWVHDQTGVRCVLRMAGTVVRPNALKCLNQIP